MCTLAEGTTYLPTYIYKKKKSIYIYVYIYIYIYILAKYLCCGKDWSVCFLLLRRQTRAASPNAFQQLQSTTSHKNRCLSETDPYQRIMMTQIGILCSNELFISQKFINNTMYFLISTFGKRSAKIKIFKRYKKKLLAFLSQSKSCFFLFLSFYFFSNFVKITFVHV